MQMVTPSAEGMPTGKRSPADAALRTIGPQIACLHTTINSFEEDVRVIDGVGRKKGSKNRPKGDQQAKHKVMKPSRSQNGNQAQLSPQLMAQLEDMAQEQSATNSQAAHQPVLAGMFLQQGALGALPQVHHAYPEAVGNNMYVQNPSYIGQPAPGMVARPSMHDANNWGAVVQPMVNHQVQMTPLQVNVNWNNWHWAGLGQQQEAGLQGMNVAPQQWGHNPYNGAAMGEGGAMLPG
ncbi:unnamed protein product [Fusarium venenatum]|uniref:Uncharacterized protein n=1 Tax=Fusarium venenatum TaxID=56646 RepID=A0A2L2TH67_9HYPO|nr:uncharacterized protein FVRRES_06812 [Fusarium venenatum]CEI62376.1 unnamed protein product [Fusarium venenatum]